MSGFSLEKLLVDVFEPQADECVTVLADYPHGEIVDHQEWRDRRQMAAEWQAAFVRLGQQRGFFVYDLLMYPATGAHNADLPEAGMLVSASGEQRCDLGPILARTTLAVALTEFSATAPLSLIARSQPDFRAASLPGVVRRMEQTALAADYRRVAARCHWLKERLGPAESMEVLFSTGHCWRVDLRYREVHVDDGYLPRDKAGPFRVINLPSGETFQVPYEGEKPGEPSRTAGDIPVAYRDEIVVLRVEGNRVVGVDGSGPGAQRYRVLFADDPARRNIAEVAFGCNDHAVVTGNVLEDEKAGFHWAFGRSDHLGGGVGVADFVSPHTVIHQDIVYARDSPIQAQQVILLDAVGRETAIIQDGQVCYPPEVEGE